MFSSPTSCQIFFPTAFPFMYCNIIYVLGIFLIRIFFKKLFCRTWLLVQLKINLFNLNFPMNGISLNNVQLSSFHIKLSNLLWIGSYLACCIFSTLCWLDYALSTCCLAQWIKYPTIWYIWHWCLHGEMFTFMEPFNP